MLTIMQTLLGGGSLIVFQSQASAGRKPFMWYICIYIQCLGLNEDTQTESWQDGGSVGEWLQHLRNRPVAKKQIAGWDGVTMLASQQMGHCILSTVIQALIASELDYYMGVPLRLFHKLQ